MDGVSPSPVRELSQAFFRSNLERLRLGERTRAALESAAAVGEVLLLRDGTPVLRYRDVELGAPTDDLWLHRAVREGADDSAFVVFGLGLGHTARALRALTGAPILIYEPDPGLARRALEAGPTDLGDLPLVCSNHDLTQLWPYFGGDRDNVTLISTPGYGQLYRREDNELREAVTQLVQRVRVNDATHRLRAREWIFDVLENLELVGDAPCFLGLAQKYQGVPAFIVGAGPSLGKNVELLAEATQKGIVFAVNSSALALARAGVEPQVVACMESIDLSHLLSKIPYLDNVVRAFSLTAHPRTLRTGRGPLLPVYEGLAQLAAPLAELLGGRGLSVCGSVSTLAFSLAQQLGCSPIVLVGQDLAYTGGEAYARGSPYEGSRVSVTADGKSLAHLPSETLKQANNKAGLAEPLCEVIAWGGNGSVPSTIGFSAVRAWFELAADVLGRECPGQKLVNATEGGGRIAGFEERTLADVLRELPERRITPAALAADARDRSPPPSAERVDAWLDTQQQRTGQARRAARRVARLCRSALAALDRGDPRAVSRSFGALARAEQLLRSAVENAPFVDAVSWAAVDEVVRPNGRAHSDHERARAAVVTEAELAVAIERCAGELNCKLREARQRIEKS
jgi:hypothetical protein